MAELLTFLLAVIIITSECKLFKIKSFTACWFTAFGYSIALWNLKPKGAEEEALTFLTYLILSVVALYLIKQRKERFKGVYEAILAFFIGVSPSLINLGFC
ncbi:hypothetical protein [Thermovibrio sp.]